MEPSTRPEQTSRDEVGQVRVRARERCHPPGGGTPQDSSRDVLQDVHICTFGPFGPTTSGERGRTAVRERQVQRLPPATLMIVGEPSNEHERDAVVAAVCAREGCEGRWPTDLAEQRSLHEQNPQAYWLAPMSYFWPESV